MILAVPLTMFLRGLPDRTHCGVKSYEVGSPIASANDTPHYVRSFAEIVNSTGTVVGWVYLADNGFGHKVSEYVQGSDRKSAIFRKTFAVTWPDGSSVSSIVKIGDVWPTRRLVVRRCPDEGGPGNPK